MRYGICILPEHRWSVAGPQWQRAEQLGFDHVWTYDHVVWGGLPESPWYAATPTLTAAALATSTIGLGMFVASPNFRHPVPFARELQSLADISGDRLLIGLGAGGDPDATILGESGLPPGRRVDRLQEFTGLLDRVLSEDHVTVGGEYFSSTDMRLNSEPIRPRNPFLLAGNGPRSVRFAARHGDGWITTGPRSDTHEEWFASVTAASVVLDDELAATGRARADFPTYLSLDSGPANSLAGKQQFIDMTYRAAELGFSDVICHWPRDTEPYRARLDVLEEVAAEVIAR